MISINAPIQDISTLSVKATTLLGWVPGAVEWLQQAIEDKSYRYIFSSEAALIKSISSGLYSTDLLCIGQSGIQAAPDFLMLLSVNQIQTLAGSIVGTTAQDCDGQNNPILVSLSQETGAITLVDYKQAHGVVESLNLLTHPLFQLRSLASIRELSALKQELDTQNYPEYVVAEAARFALGKLTSVRAFVGYLGTHLSCLVIYVKSIKPKK